MTEELKVGGADNVCEWWLISTSADQLIRSAGPPGNLYISRGKNKLTKFCDIDTVDVLDVC